MCQVKMINDCLKKWKDLKRRIPEKNRHQRNKTKTPFSLIGNEWQFDNLITTVENRINDYKKWQGTIRGLGGCPHLLVSSLKSYVLPKYSTHTSTEKRPRVLWKPFSVFSSKIFRLFLARESEFSSSFSFSFSQKWINLWNMMQKSSLQYLLTKSLV